MSCERQVSFEGFHTVCGAPEDVTYCPFEKEGCPKNPQRPMNAAEKFVNGLAFALIEAAHHAQVTGTGVIVRNGDAWKALSPDDYVIGQRGEFTPSPIARIIEVVRAHQPMRDDDVARWLKAKRDGYGSEEEFNNLPISKQVAVNAIDLLLDEYRECADTGHALMEPAEDEEDSNSFIKYTYGDGSTEVVRFDTYGMKPSIEFGQLEKVQRAWRVDVYTPEEGVRCVKNRFGGIDA